VPALVRRAEPPDEGLVRHAPERLDVDHAVRALVAVALGPFGAVEPEVLTPIPGGDGQRDRDARSGRDDGANKNDRPHD
jgi:hypothetical protein